MYAAKAQQPTVLELVLSSAWVTSPGPEKGSAEQRSFQDRVYVPAGSGPLCSQQQCLSGCA